MLNNDLSPSRYQLRLKLLLSRSTSRLRPQDPIGIRATDFRPAEERTRGRVRFHRGTGC